MSISSDINRIKGAKADLETAIEAKGVTVPVGTLIDGYAALVGTIPAGTDTSDANATESDILLGKTAYVDGEKKTGTSTLNADTTDATLTENDMLYGVTGYGPDGTKLTGAGALWDKVKELNNTFSGSTLEEPINVYAPNAVLTSRAFNSSKFTAITLTLSRISGAFYAFYGCGKCVTITMATSSDPSACFSERTFSGCTALTTINYTFDCTNVLSTAFTFASCAALVTISFVASTIKMDLSFSSSSLLSTASLLSIANGLDAGSAPKTLTMHATSKTNMGAIMVDNVAGVAVIGSAMTLSAFITGVKGWTIA